MAGLRHPQPAAVLRTAGALAGRHRLPPPCGMNAACGGPAHALVPPVADRHPHPAPAPSVGRAKGRQPAGRGIARASSSPAATYLQVPYTEVAALIRQQGCLDVGLMLGGHAAEYPIWYLLGAPRRSSHRVAGGRDPQRKVLPMLTSTRAPSSATGAKTRARRFAACPSTTRARAIGCTWAQRGDPASGTSTRIRRTVW